MTFSEKTLPNALVQSEFVFEQERVLDISSKDIYMSAPLDPFDRLYGLVRVGSTQQRHKTDTTEKSDGYQQAESGISILVTIYSVISIVGNSVCLVEITKTLVRVAECPITLNAEKFRSFPSFRTSR